VSYLSRVRLRRDASLAALANVLVPPDADERGQASHRLVWSLFADGADRTRDFLWREEKPGQFMTLSARAPEDPHKLFEVQTKPFAPLLSPGDRLGFMLRVNPTVSRCSEPRKRGKRHDLVMDLLRHVPPGERAEARPELVSDAAHGWLARQGEANGFSGLDLAVGGYDRVEIPRDNASAAVLGVLDVFGVLEVTEPARFLDKLQKGFGRARAFGCGLMLIRRAR
jgi:CRISPR system Cascade subunit CasE